MLTYGPFSGAKEVVGSYRTVQVKSREEAIECASRSPAAGGDVIEVRQVHGFAEFPPAVQIEVEKHHQARSQAGRAMR